MCILSDSLSLSLPLSGELFNDTHALWFNLFNTKRPNDFAHLIPPPPTRFTTPRPPTPALPVPEGKASIASRPLLRSRRRPRCNRGS